MSDELLQKKVMRVAHLRSQPTSGAAPQHPGGASAPDKRIMCPLLLRVKKAKDCKKYLRRSTEKHKPYSAPYTVICTRPSTLRPCLAAFCAATRSLHAFSTQIAFSGSLPFVNLILHFDFLFFPVVPRLFRYKFNYSTIY